MIIVIMFLVTVLLGLIAWVACWKIELCDVIWVTSLISAVILGTITTFMLICCIFIHIPFCKNQKLIEYNQKYIAITQAIDADINNTIVLADKIAEYNSNILKGRMMQDSKWFSALDYDFYYDLPLIELDNSKKES